MAGGSLQIRKGIPVCVPVVKVPQNKNYLIRHTNKAGAKINPSPF